MTPEEKRAKLNEYKRKWYANHKEQRSKYFRSWYENRKITKPCDCVCHKCGKSFKSARKILCICPDCRTMPTKDRKAEIKRNAKIEIIKAIIEEYKSGKTQTFLGNKYGISQKTVSNYVIGKGKLVNSICKDK